MDRKARPGGRGRPARIRRGDRDALAFHGYAAVQAERGDAGLDKALHGGCDLVILDLVLPGADGLAVLREVRRARPTLPVIILTARGDEARPRARPARRAPTTTWSSRSASASCWRASTRSCAARPSGPRTSRRLDHPAAECVDLERREVAFDGRRARASSREREAELLRYLAANAGAGRVARGDAVAGLGDRPARRRDADHRHARGAAPREAARRRAAPQPARHRARQGLPLGHAAVREAARSSGPLFGAVPGRASWWPWAGAARSCSARARPRPPRRPRPRSRRTRASRSGAWTPRSRRCSPRRARGPTSITALLSRGARLREHVRGGRDGDPRALAASARDSVRRASCTSSSRPAGGSRLPRCPRAALRGTGPEPATVAPACFREAPCGSRELKA